MPRSRKIEVDWQQEDEMWVVAGGKLEEPIAVLTVELREHFPVFLRAAQQFVAAQTTAMTEDDLESLLGKPCEDGEVFVGYQEG
ncbi:hypothetical protein R1sor_020112 [Riccia sorocarpa]|uniref:DUF1902 domain-containing protein n=1 Tax=Riccia sorocarpa TaxID=122646 RepID=A0ABD3IED5_9MARC